MPGLLKVEFTLHPRRARKREEFVAHAILTNKGDEPLVVNLAPLSSPSLALEILDSHGSPAPLPPPPVPGGPASSVLLAVSQQHNLEYRGFVPAWFDADTYRLRLRYVYRPPAPGPREWTGQVFSEWVEFTVLR